MTHTLGLSPRARWYSSLSSTVSARLYSNTWITYGLVYTPGMTPRMRAHAKGSGRPGEVAAREKASASSSVKPGALRLPLKLGGVHSALSPSGLGAAGPPAVSDAYAAGKEEGTGRVGVSDPVASGATGGVGVVSIARVLAASSILRSSSALETMKGRIESGARELVTLPSRHATRHTSQMSS